MTGTDLAIQTDDLNRLNIVHVAGTKGKGSTCAFVDSILSQYRTTIARPQKTGLFISPHLIAVRERIRINSAPISEDMFARYFFDVWDRLGSSNGSDAENGSELAAGSRPIYSRYLTLMSWHVFLQEGVDVAVYETGIGGSFDATNLVEKPVASGISTLGIDHVFALGDTVEKISWHKAGIMKAGSPAFTTSQVPGAAQVLRDRAADKKVDLQFLEIDPRLANVRIRPNAAFQKRNASLGVALAETALRKLGVLDKKPDVLPQEFVEGLEKVEFRGRCEVKKEDTVTWHIDAAHTADSLKLSSKWFIEEIGGATGPRVLIFNQPGRSEAIDFLPLVHAATQRTEEGKPAFDHVVFCTNVTYVDTGYKKDFVNHQLNPKEVESMSLQKRFAERWRELDPGAEVTFLPTIEHALRHARKIGEKEPAQVFLTGSLHLVGGALGVLEKADAL